MSKLKICKNEQQLDDVSHRETVLCAIGMPESPGVIIPHMVCLISALPSVRAQYHMILCNFFLYFEKNNQKKYINKGYFSTSELSKRVYIPSHSSTQQISYIPRVAVQLNIYRRDYEYFARFSNQNERHFYNASV